MVDSVIADLGHRFECTACKAISLRRGDLANLTLAQTDLPEVPWEIATQSLMSCSTCPTEKLTEIVYDKKFPEPLYYCKSCKGMLISHESLGRIRRHRLKLEVRDPSFQVWLDPKEGYLTLMAFPASIIVAWLCDVLVLPAMLLKGINIQFHEFGHTITSWMTGVAAVPMAVVTIPFAMPKIAVYGLWLLGLLYWTNRGRQEQLKAFTGFFVALIGLQFYLTFVLDAETAKMLVVLNGVMGEFLIPMVLGLMFFYKLPRFWNWNAFRYLGLFVAMYCLQSNSQFWAEVVKGKAQMPFGSLVGGSGDAAGDMDRLVRVYGWTEAFLSRIYNMTGHLATWTLWGHFGYFLFQRMRKDGPNPSK